MRTIINDKEIGKRIQTLRKQAHLTQQQLADRIPTCRSAICKIESGENGVSVFTAVKLADMFNVSLEYLLLGDTNYFSLENFQFSNKERDNGPLNKIWTFIDFFSKWNRYKDLQIELAKLTHISNSYHSLLAYIIREHKQDLDEYEKGNKHALTEIEAAK